MIFAPLRSPATLCDAFSVGRSHVTLLSGNHSFALSSLTNPIPDPCVRLLSPTDFGEVAKKEHCFSEDSEAVARPQRSRKRIVTAQPHRAQRFQSSPVAFINRRVSRCASATQASIWSGSGLYSSSIEMQPSISSAAISFRYGSNATTPRPGGRSP